jgi:hypothetical protein
MSYAEAKQIALLRLELRSCWDRRDLDGAAAALATMRHLAVAENDNELEGELRRWTAKLSLAA